MILSVISIISMVLPVKAESLFPACASPFELKGRCVIFPTYNGGNTFFPFVFQKDCFYTGKMDKKMIAGEKFIGEPITINDVQILNKGKSSEKLCMLVSNCHGDEFSVVIPLRVNKITDDLKIFQDLYYNHRGPSRAFSNDPFLYYPDQIDLKCYDYSLIKKIEDECAGKCINHTYYDLKKGFKFERFFFKQVFQSDDMRFTDDLYIEFSGEVVPVMYLIKPIVIKEWRYEDYRRQIALEDICNLF